MTSSGNWHGLLGYCGMSTIRIFDYVDYQDWRLCGLLVLETVLIIGSGDCFHCCDAARGLGASPPASPESVL